MDTDRARYKAMLEEAGLEYDEMPEEDGTGAATGGVWVRVREKRGTRVLGGGVFHSFNKAGALTGVWSQDS